MEGRRASRPHRTKWKQRAVDSIPRSWESQQLLFSAAQLGAQGPRDADVGRGRTDASRGVQGCPAHRGPPGLGQLGALTPRPTGPAPFRPVCKGPSNWGSSPSRAGLGAPREARNQFGGSEDVNRPDVIAGCLPRLPPAPHPTLRAIPRLRRNCLLLGFCPPRKSGGPWFLRGAALPGSLQGGSRQRGEDT